VTRTPGDGAASAHLLFSVAGSVGIIAGTLGMPVAHELMHRRGALDRALAKVLLMMSSYPHFCLEHVHGHHRRVATHADPATARVGESLYAFYPRAIGGGFRHAWNLEAARLRRDRERSFSLHNRVLADVVVLLGLYAIITVVFGRRGVAYFLVQSIVTISLLEVINYVTHYGLERRKDTFGRFEAVRPCHSWNSNHRVTNYLLLNLARHSDHHHAPERSYAQLRASLDAPQLPAGHLAMFVLALFPPLWRRRMDQLVTGWHAAYEPDLPDEPNPRIGAG